MNIIQENAELLTEEGRLLQQIQGDDVIDYDIDAYATRLSEILDRKVTLIFFDYFFQSCDCKCGFKPARFQVGCMTRPTENRTGKEEHDGVIGVSRSGAGRSRAGMALTLIAADEVRTGRTGAGTGGGGCIRLRCACRYHRGFLPFSLLAF